MPSPCERAARAPPGEQRLKQHLNPHHSFSTALNLHGMLISPGQIELSFRPGRAEHHGCSKRYV